MDRVKILESDNHDSLQAFVELMTNTGCSLCPLTRAEMEQWDREGQDERVRILDDFVGSIEARSDRSAMLYDEANRLVCLGRRVDDQWQFLPFEQGQWPPVDAFIGRTA